MTKNEIEQMITEGVRPVAYYDDGAGDLSLYGEGEVAAKIAAQFEQLRAENERLRAAVSPIRDLLGQPWRVTGQGHLCIGDDSDGDDILLALNRRPSPSRYAAVSAPNQERAFRAIAGLINTLRALGPPSA